jgi:uncharacterized protein with ParB-like and HNH nuclease domain
MSKLNVDQSSIKDLFDNKKSDFLIPDYQRPYAWTEDECQTLWEDIFSFAFPDSDYSKFNGDDEYYLGPIVTFKNERGKLEVIDGQQRLTTLMLLLRAFYVKFGKMKDENSKKTEENIARCIWKTDEFGNPNKEELKIDSEVATDNDKEEFLDILSTGIAKLNQKSKYAVNFRFFQEKIDSFLSEYPSFFSYLPTRILNNCILLPIEADNQNTALRIFSTLNDRGLPLSDADIFKAQFYKYYSDKNQKDRFINKWKYLEEVSEKIFKTSSTTPMDELFTRYMYYERAKLGIKSSTTEALRKFYERDSYALLKNNMTISNLTELVDFWNDVENQNNDRFSERVLRKLFVLNYAPNSMWTYFLSVYFMSNKDDKGMLDDNKLFEFLDKSIGFIWTYAIVNPGVNALRTPIYAEMIKIVNNEAVTFGDYKFDSSNIIKTFDNYGFYNRRPITKSMLTWWAFKEDNQKLISLEDVFEIEHIYARNRQDIDQSLSNKESVELLGNKILLEKRINIRASDYRFADKKKYYEGFTTEHGITKEGTQIEELTRFTKDNNITDFNESDILNRNNKIIESFIDYLDGNDLIKNKL